MNSLSFSESTVICFTSYLNNRSFGVNIGSEYSSPGKLFCGVLQSILGPLLSLLYVNGVPQAVNFELLLYADKTLHIYGGRGFNAIENQLNKDFLLTL